MFKLASKSFRYGRHLSRSRKTNPAVSILNMLHNGTNSNYIGEKVSQCEHAMQSAQWVNRRTDDDWLVGSALLHDIGHQVGVTLDLPQTTWGVLDHENIGADFLKGSGMDERVCESVRMHVNAKRYMVASNPDYVLSDASQNTLVEQGGPMTPEEMDEFRKLPMFSYYKFLRAADEQAKSEKLIDSDCFGYEELVETLIKTEHW
jgi:predicted HD phosphohydrolase